VITSFSKATKEASRLLALRPHLHRVEAARRLRSRIVGDATTSTSTAVATASTDPLSALASLPPADAPHAAYLHCWRKCCDALLPAMRDAQAASLRAVNAMPRGGHVSDAQYARVLSACRPFFDAFRLSQALLLPPEHPSLIVLRRANG
jgi:hypothetical protein